MTDRFVYLRQAADDILTYGPAMSALSMVESLDGIVAHFTDPLTAERDRARDVAVTLEQQLADVTDLHAGFDYGVGEDHHGQLCRECSVEWPCATARAAGLDVLRDDIFADLTTTEGDPF